MKPRRDVDQDCTSHPTTQNGPGLRGAGPLLGTVQDRALASVSVHIAISRVIGSEAPCPSKACTLWSKKRKPGARAGLGSVRSSDDSIFRVRAPRVLQ